MELRCSSLFSSLILGAPICSMFASIKRHLFLTGFRCWQNSRTQKSDSGLRSAPVIQILSDLEEGYLRSLSRIKVYWWCVFRSLLLFLSSAFLKAVKTCFLQRSQFFLWCLWLLPTISSSNSVQERFPTTWYLHLRTKGLS